MAENENQCFNGTEHA